MKRHIITAVAFTAVAAATVAIAQGSGSGAHAPQKGSHMGSHMGSHGGSYAGSHMGKGSGAGSHAGHAAKGDAGPASAAFREANDRMHRDMDIVFTGNADADFVRGMIPHHQGAIDMAKVVLAHGKDASIRKLAEEIIKAQEGEIAMMNDWLKKNAK
jgi:hypothetical protein